jgi:DNA-binding protein YbaB
MSTFKNNQLKMNAFGDIKNIMKLRKEAKSIQKKLKSIHVEAEEGDIVVTISAEQEIVKVEIKNNELDSKLKATLEEQLMKAFNKGIKKSQEIAAENMKGLLGQLGGGLGDTN